MSVLKILTYPDVRLREVSEEVKKFDSVLEVFSKDLLETMYAENGIGLAAPQVDRRIRMLVIDTRPRDTKGRYEKNELTELESKVEQPLIIINPVVKNGKGKTTFDEGCLSVPSFYETVERYETITLEYQTVRGEKKTLVTDGLLAICIQHEIDHLDGTLFIDHLTTTKSNLIKTQIKKHGYPEKVKKSSTKETQ
jgi:peptide deformylase